MNLCWYFGLDGQANMYSSWMAILALVGSGTETLMLALDKGRGNLVLNVYIVWLLRRMPPHLRVIPRRGRSGWGDLENSKKR